MATVLVVDDVASETQLIVMALQSAGYVCVTASNGEEGLAKAKAQKPSLILLDVVMPKQDGFATCRMLKKDSDTSTIPVVMVTSKNQQSDVFWGKKQGASDYVCKPFSPGDLIKTVKKYV